MPRVSATMSAPATLCEGGRLQASQNQHHCYRPQCHFVLHTMGPGECLSEIQHLKYTGRSYTLQSRRRSDLVLNGRTTMSDADVFLYEQLDDVLVVTPLGDLFQYRYDALRTAYNDTYRKITDESIKHLLIDFQSVGHFGSAFIGMLIKLAKAVRNGGGEATLCGLTADMKDVLDNLMLLENVKTDFFWIPLPGRPEALEFLKSKKA